MKRFLNIILCTFIILLCVFTLIKINNNVKTQYKTEKVLVSEKNIFNSIKKANDSIEKAEKEKQEKLERERIEKEKSIQKRNTVIKTSTNKKIVKTNNTTKKTNIKYGTFGRLYVSNYSVALYDYNVNTNSSSSLQTIVNNKDSAAYYMTNGKLVIADHNYQGFRVLVNIPVGTKSNIKFKNGSTITYKLIKKSKGVNTGPDLIDTKGNSFFKMKSDIIMYTCYEDGIMVTLWSLV